MQLTCTRKGGPPQPVTILLATPNAHFIEPCTHAVILEEGHVLEAGEISVLKARKGHLYRFLTRQEGLFIDSRGRATISAERLRRIW